MGSMYRYIVIFGFLAMASCSEKEQSSPSTSLKQSYLKVFQDIRAEKTFQISVGGDYALCGYRLTTNQIQVMLLNKNGEEVWKRDLNGTVMRQILYQESTGLFHVIVSKDLYKFTIEGVLAEYHPLFFDVLPISYNPQNYVLTPESDYLLFGSILSNSRAFISKISSAGKEIFRDVYVVDLFGRNSFTDGIIEEDGSIVAAGCRNSIVDTIPNVVFLVKYDYKGKLLSERVGSIGNPNFIEGGDLLGNSFGRELIKQGNNGYLYSTAPPQSSSSSLVSKIYNLSFYTDPFEKVELGDSFKNYVAGNGGTFPRFVVGTNGFEMSSVGRGMIKLKNGKIFGVVNESLSNDLDGFIGSSDLTELTRINAYIYLLNSDGEIDYKTDVDRSYNNAFSGVAQFNSGEILVFGLSRSLGGNSKLTLLAYE